MRQRLRAGGLPGAHQPDVSVALSQLEEKQFVKKIPAGAYIPRDGWADFGLEKTLKKALRMKKIDDLTLRLAILWRRFGMRANTLVGV